MNNESMVCNTCGEGEGRMNVCHGNDNCCGMYYGSSHHRNFLLRLIIGIVILMIVFSMGVKIGEYKGMYGDAYGDRWMMHDYYNGYQRPMMYNQRLAPIGSPVPEQK